MDQRRALAIVLRCIGCLDALALVAVVMPRQWMNVTAVSLGLDPLPPDAIVGYLARSASVMYALHGLTVFYVSFDVVRYWRLIRFLAILAVFHGVVMLGIDVAEGMPRWWQCVEGPCFAATGAVVLWLQRRRRRG
jgi:hypothetical protein